MNLQQKKKFYHFEDEIRLLFYRRTIICLWLGIVFFSLFSILDYWCCKEFFTLFLFYRLVLIVVFVVSLKLLRLPLVAHHAPLLMYVVLLLGSLSISLMVLKMGGFISGYYVGILLMTAGAISVLPLRASQAVFTGLSIYAVYLFTVFLGQRPIDPQNAIFAVINSFFFFAIIAGTAIQSLDDMQVRINSLRAKNSIYEISKKLSNYTDNLESLIVKRMAEQAASDLKFRDLYSNLMDLAILVDRDGVIHMANEHSVTLLGISPVGLRSINLREVIHSQDREKDIVDEIIAKICSGLDLHDMQLQLKKDNGTHIDVELSGNRVVMEKSTPFYQLIFRDISITKQMERQILESERLIDTSRQAAIFGLAKLAETRDDDTGAHLDRIRLYVYILANQLKKNPALNGIVTKDFTEDIFLSSILHDIGKVGIPDRILLKPGKLTKDEYDIMKSHCIFGNTTLKQAETDSEYTSFLQMGQDITLYHHEKWDGTGYPEGRAGNTIPLAARIVALADVYDALTTSRVYKPAYGHDFSKKIILDGRGGHFDPDIVEAFLLGENEFKETRMNLLRH
jgi:PAS domain S-box-containing protein